MVYFLIVTSGILGSATFLAGFFFGAWVQRRVVEAHLSRSLPGSFRVAWPHRQSKSDVEVMEEDGGGYRSPYEGYKH